MKNNGNLANEIQLSLGINHFTELCEIAKKYGTDKYQHGYTKIYNELLKDRKSNNVNIFEIGIYLGNSIKMWHDYFENGKIFGVDNGRLLPNSGVNISHINENPNEDDKKLLEGYVVSNFNFSWLENDRIKCAVADQRSEEQLESAMNHFGCKEFDLILDDGQHYQEHQQKSLGILFKNVKSGGFYIIEDISDIDDLLYGNIGYPYPQFWGQKRLDCTDCTFTFYKNYIQTGKIESDYMTEEEKKYLSDNVDYMFMFDGGVTKIDGTKVESNCFLREGSKTLVIKKK